MKLFKQKNIGQQWGMFAQVVGQAGIFIAVVNLFLLSVTAYNTTLSPWFESKGINVQFWVFGLAIVVPLVIVGLLLYKYALPSFFGFWNDQFYRHDSLLRGDIELLKKENKEILGAIKELKDNDKKD